MPKLQEHLKYEHDDNGRSRTIDRKTGSVVHYGGYSPRHDKKVLPVHHPARKYLSVGDACMFLMHVYGIETSVDTIRKWIRKGMPNPQYGIDPDADEWMWLTASAMPTLRQKIYIKREDLVNWVEYVMIDGKTHMENIRKRAGRKNDKT